MTQTSQIGMVIVNLILLPHLLKYQEKSEILSTKSETNPKFK